MSVRILSDVLRERLQVEQHVREGKHAFSCADPAVPYADKLAVLTEEVGEVAREVNEHTLTTIKYARAPQTMMPPHRERHYCKRLREELIQVAQVAVAWIEALDAFEEKEAELASSTEQS